MRDSAFVQSSFTEAASRLADQKNPHLLLKLKISLPFLQKAAMSPSFGTDYSNSHLPTLAYRIYFNIILSSSIGLPTNIPYAFLKEVYHHLLV
jgi:hypothetical protein